MKGRDGLQRATVYNEGLAVFLCDSSLRGKLRKQFAPVWSGEASPAKQDELLRGLAREGTLLAYDLIQDDELDVGVSVGQPLDEAERGTLPWLVSEPALLHLPSGKLSIDSLNSMDAGAEEKPAVLEVPPGRYLARVHWVDLVKLEGKLDGPSQIVTLTPTEETAWPQAVPRLSPHGHEPPPPPEPGTLTVAQLKRNDHLVELLLTGVEGLELVRGDHLVIAVGGEKSHAFFHGKHYPSIYGYLFGDERFEKLEASCLQASWSHFSGGKGRPLPALDVSAGTDTPFAGHPLFQLPVGAQVKVSKHPEPYEKPVPLPKCKVKDGAIEAQVLASHPLMLALNLNYAAEKKIGLGKWMEVEVGGQTLVAEALRGVNCDDRPPALKAALNGARPPKFEPREYWGDEGKMIVCITPAHVNEGETRALFPVFAVGTPVKVRAYPRP